jgi:RNA polymerase sigma factor (sigma-70 family)
MHDWPIDDAQIVAAIVAGDAAGLAAAYDLYAAALYAYCRSLLAEPADAADAVQDTFVLAASKLGGLRDPDRLRPWLYAVARNECHRRLRARARVADLDEAGEMSDDSADVGGAAERGELRDLVRSAIAGLNPGEREVIELTLRHEHPGRLPPGHAHADPHARRHPHAGEDSHADADPHAHALAHPSANQDAHAATARHAGAPITGHGHADPAPDRRAVHRDLHADRGRRHSDVHDHGAFVG